MMLTVAQSPTGFSVVTALWIGWKFNEGDHLNKVLIPLFEWGHKGGGGTFRKLIVHADDAAPHQAMISRKFPAQNGMGLETHAPYLPDLAPSDFYLFGHVKGLLRGKSFEAGEDVLSNCGLS
jgi:hypothetical protein